MAAAFLSIFVGMLTSALAQPTPRASSEASLRIEKELLELKGSLFDAHLASYRYDRLRHWMRFLEKCGVELPPLTRFVIDAHSKWEKLICETYLRAGQQDGIAALSVTYYLALTNALAVSRGKVPSLPPVPQGALELLLSSVSGRTTPDNFIARVIVIAWCNATKGEHDLNLSSPLSFRAVLKSDATPRLDVNLSTRIDSDLEILRAFAMGRPAEQPPPSPAPAAQEGNGSRAAFVRQLVVRAILVLGGVGALGALALFIKRRKINASHSTPPIDPVVAQQGVLAQVPSPSEGFSLEKLAGLLPKRYTNGEMIGSGGMAVVFKAHDDLLNRMVAIKMISPMVRDNVDARKRFVREARTLASLSHPNISPIFDVQSEPWPFFSMELLCGTCLSDLNRGEEVTDERFFDIALDLLRALEHAHERGVIHRDIKPENLFVRQDGVLQLIDFGIAKDAGGTNLTKTGQTCGTLTYMAPEQLEGRVDARSDLYTAGLVFYELLAGRLPFDREDRQAKLVSFQLQVNPRDLGLPRGEFLAPVLQKALQPNPDLRFQDACEFSAALRRARDGLLDRDRGALCLLDELEDLRARSLHTLTGRFAIALVLEDEPLRFAEAFVGPQAVGEILTALSGDDGVEQRLERLAKSAALQAGRRELLPILEIVDTLKAEIPGFARMASVFARLSEEIRKGKAIDDVAAFQARIGGVASRLKELSEKIRAAVGKYRVDVAELLSSRAAGLAARGVTARVTDSTDMAAVTLDPVRFRTDLDQVFDCLLENAFQAHARNVSARWSLEPEQAILTLRLEDDGDGFPEGGLERLFSPSFTTKKAGTGTGLMLARTLLRRHGGAILLERLPGKGAAVVVTLPTRAVVRASG